MSLITVEKLYISEEGHLHCPLSFKLSLILSPFVWFYFSDIMAKNFWLRYLCIMSRQHEFSVTQEWHSGKCSEP